MTDGPPPVIVTSPGYPLWPLVRATLALVLLAALVACQNTRDVLSAPASSRPAALCATAAGATTSGCWAQIRPLGSGGFPPAPGSNDRPVWAPGKFPLTLRPVLAFAGNLWMTAQTVIYASPDGLEWSQHDKTDWGERIYHSIVYFHGKLWMYGGMDYMTGRFLNDMWETSDGASWSMVGTAPWSPRGGHALVVYHDRLWLISGGDHAAPDRSLDRYVNDVWVSDDGEAWTRVTASAPWPPRASPVVVVFDDALFLLGGQGTADVWRSTDGRDWTAVTTGAWPPRQGFGSAVLDGKMWVFGGTSGPSTNALNDVWYSSDGATWQRQTEHAPWGPRAPIATVFAGKVWIYSGKHTGAPDNWGGDLWQMTAG